MNFKILRQMGILAVLIALVAISVSASLQTPVQAQDGNDLSEEEKALLERLLTAGQPADYSSYIADVSRSQTTTFSIGMMGFSLDQSQVRTVESSRQVITGDDRNVLATFVATSEDSSSTFGVATTSSYTIESEARLVDGVLYVQAEYADLIDPTGAIPALDDGWIKINNAADIPFALSVLELGELYAENEGGFAEETIDPLALDNYFEGLETLQRLARTVTLSSTTIDGMTYDLITVTVGFDDLLAEAEDSIDVSDPFVGVILEAFSDGEMEVSGALDENNSIVQLNLSMLVEIEDLPINTAEMGLESELGDTEILFSISLDYQQTTVYSQINEPLEPVTAP